MHMPSYPTKKDFMQRLEKMTFAIEISERLLYSQSANVTNARESGICHHIYIILA